MKKLNILIEEAYQVYQSYLEESPHKNNPLLNKYLPRNKENRNLLAEKLRFLRGRRDFFRENNRDQKSNVIDNISRSLTNAGATDPVLRKSISTPLNKFNRNEKASLFTFSPKMTNLPHERLDSVNPDPFQSYMGPEDVKSLQKSLRITHDKHTLDDNVWEMFKTKPRLSSTIREMNPMLSYKYGTKIKRHY